ncbi:S-type pyocin domain-containing protein [Buttiauxella sp. WJP83]|uniref:S-type pyocin domain-containing protein n=1 Tax=Buttiauxella sp. WJP83 TaxID=2986951 RepID=UPI0022DE1029|nr:S-type pyocin domain-containing protein [Buttiauxella sp. WJP83]WBM72768.1 S-type pyocin domain-containing protein [Buttiauxella sp. WJP83]
MTRVGGSTAVEGVLAANPLILWAGVLYSALYVGAAGEGSDKVPGRDEYWYEEELRSKAASGAKATTRVRFFWQPDIHGKMQVYGVHTGEGTQYEGVRVANMVWSTETQRYEFTPANGVDGPTITWTPGKPEGTDLPTHTGTDAPTLDQPTILVNPIPENQGDMTIPPFPVPDEKDFNDYILVFPADSGIKPIYVYLKSARDEPGTATGKGEILSGAGKWLEEEAGKGLGALIPIEIADRLRGQNFSNFGEFRKALWTEVSNSTELLNQFKLSNIAQLKSGRAPFPRKKDQVGGRVKYEIHHVSEISKGGDVYNVDNLRIVTPKRHINIHRGVK